jgi:hypothetical protein
LTSTLPLSLQGEWWVPDRSAKFAGTLAIDRSGRAMLTSTAHPGPEWFPEVDKRTLIDGLPGFEELHQSLLDDEVTIPAVHGVADGRHMTLLNCRVHETAKWLGWDRVRVTPSVVLLGACLWPHEYIMRGMTVELEDLGAWTGWLSYLSGSSAASPGERPPAPPDHSNTSAEIGALTIGVLRSSDTVAEVDRIGTQSTVREGVELSISKYPGDTDLWTLTEFIDAARCVQDMLTFATGRACAIASTTLWFCRRLRSRQYS